MRHLGILAFAVAALALAQPAVAEEIIYFTNGTSMPIRSHRMEGDMVHVDLGGNGFMAFPTFLIDRVEETEDVSLKPSSTRPVSNRMVATSGRGGGNSGGRGGGGGSPYARAAQTQRDPGPPRVQVDQYGMARGTTGGTGAMRNAARSGAGGGAVMPGGRQYMQSGTGEGAGVKPRVIGVEMRQARDENSSVVIPKTPTEKPTDSKETGGQ